jgi:hypothetical protein
LITKPGKPKNIVWLCGIRVSMSKKSMLKA